MNYNKYFAVNSIFEIFVTTSLLSSLGYQIELIQNGGFEETSVVPPQTWIGRVVDGRFSSRKVKDTEACIQTKSSRDDKQTVLRIGRLSSSSHTLVLSQYVDVLEVIARGGGGLTHLQRNSLKSKPLIFSVDTLGNQSTNIQIVIDIRYDDGLFQIASLQLNASSGRNCFFIQNNSSLSRIMIHLISQGSTRHETLVDNVSLKLVDRQHLPESCLVHIKSAPFKRKILPNFLQRQLNHTDPWDAITIATQMTADRLKILEISARMWQGPISAAVLLFKKDGAFEDQIETLKRAYLNTPELHKYVNIHMVFEDTRNGLDSSLYPTNFLRNVATSMATSDHVFLLDVDCVPGFTHDEALTWTGEESRRFKSSTDPKCSKCAFIAPVFNVGKAGQNLPANKSELLKMLKQKEFIERNPQTSQQEVLFDTWLTGNTSYSVDLRGASEPYFIVRKNAPLCNDMYIGYGRDHVSCVGNVRDAGVRFIVLQRGFLLNIQNGILFNRGSTVRSRSKGVPLRMHLTLQSHSIDNQRGLYIFKEDFLRTMNFSNEANANREENMKPVKSLRLKIFADDVRNIFNIQCKKIALDLKTISEHERPVPTKPIRNNKLKPGLCDMYSCKLILVAAIDIYVVLQVLFLSRFRYFLQRVIRHFRSPTSPDIDRYKRETMAEINRYFKASSGET